MAQGTITQIVEDSQRLRVTVDIGGAKYEVFVSKAVFDALLTDVAKLVHIISVISSTRRTSRQSENAYATLVNAVVVVPD